MAGSSRSRNRNRNIDSMQVQRERANKRERERTKSLNSAYIHLRQKIPSLPSDKTSKIHTLRVTIEYIHFLYEMVYNQGNILNRMDLTIQDDNQINLPATFNSWRTSLNQKFHLNMMKQQQTQKRNLLIQQELQEQRQFEIADTYCPVDFSNFIDPNCMESTRIEQVGPSKSSKSKRIKSENAADHFYANYNAVEANTSLTCALGQVISQSQL